MPDYLKLYLLFCIVFLLKVSYSFSQEKGLPFIKSYEPDNYDGSTEVWASIRDNDGILYLASFENILQFDGKLWKKIPVKKNTYVRSISIDKSGIIYVGASGEFGYLAEDSLGGKKYRSLSNQLDKENSNFSEVWNICTTDKGVYFSTSRRLFFFKLPPTPANTKIKTWEHKSSVHSLFKVANDIYLSQRDVGLLVLKGNDLKVVPKTEELKKHVIRFMLPYKNGKILISTAKNGFFIYDKNATSTDSILIQFSNSKTNLIKKTNKELRRNLPAHGVKIDDSTFAIATGFNGIYIISENGEIKQNLSKKDGLISNNIRHLYIDIDGILWASGEYGLSKIEVSSPYTYWDQRLGLKGIPKDIIRSNNTIYCSSNKGIYYHKKNRFSLLGDSVLIGDTYFLNLLNIKKSDKNNQSIITNSRYSIFEAEKNSINFISGHITRNLFPSVNSNKFYFFENNRLFSVSWENNNWVTSIPMYTFDSDTLSLKETINGKLWIIEKNNPILLEPVKGEINNYKARRFEEDLQENELTFSTVFQYKGNDYFITNKGIYRYHFDKGSFYPDTTLFAGILNNLKGEIKQIQFNTPNSFFVSIFADDSLKLLAIKYESGKAITESIIYRQLPKFYSFQTDSNKNLWVLTKQGLIQIDLTKNYKLNNQLKTVICGIEAGKDLIISKGKKTFKDNIILDYEQNNITFKYILPFFINEDDILYSYKLEGDRKLRSWSRWSKETKRNFNNLNEGDYTFWVKAKNIYGIESNAAKFNFTITTPWYKTIYLKILYLILIVIAIWTVVKLNAVRLHREKAQLEKVIEKRTGELQQQKQEIEEVYEELRVQNEKITSQRDMLSSQNTHISDSIIYAQRIQTAVLTKEAYIDEILPENFILFKPRDIVSGDFYWIRQIGQKIIIAIADCTGHGVPGAIMSMLGISYLNEIVRKSEITQANQVLNEMRKRIKRALHQTGKKGEAVDGMDMVLCAIDLKTKIMQYSGAFNPLLIIRNNEIIEIKADRMPVGIYHNEKPSFTNHEIPLMDNDVFYMFSDGYADQLGGEKRLKFMYANFKRKLLEIHNKPMNVQKGILEDTIENWKLGIEQTDDIIVMGIRI
ncbi:MAG: SpoIIE family protein phosphatase [Bacteroidota bacterium]